MPFQTILLLRVQSKCGETAFSHFAATQLLFEIKYAPSAAISKTKPQTVIFYTAFKEASQHFHMSFSFVKISYIGHINPAHFLQNSFIYEIWCLLHFVYIQ